MKKLLFVIMLGLFASPCAKAQVPPSSKNKKAVELYTEAGNLRVKGRFSQAIAMLKEAIKKDKKFYEAYFRLGLTYKNAGDMKLGAEILEQGILLTPDVRRQSLFHFELGDAYLRSGVYDKALPHLDAFLADNKTLNTKSEQALLWKKHAQYGLEHQHEDLGYREELLSDTINAFPMQYYPVLTADNNQIIFVRRSGNRYEDDEDIFTSYRNAAGRWTAPVSLSNKINTPVESQGTCTVSADGRYLILTFCGAKGYGSCDLFESRKTGDAWSVPVNLGPKVNGRRWDSQPALSADGQELYFASDREGGLGGKDIWYSKRDSSGRWTKAVNAGNVINTKYEEYSPFIHVNNRNLYFASNASGFGGADIFVTERMNKVWTAPRNMGGKLNNHDDQYSFFVTSDGKRAYYAKDGAGLSNVSRLYTTLLPVSAQVKYYSNVVTGTVRDKETKTPLKAQVELRDVKTDERVSVVQSDSVTGNYAIVLTQGSEYALYSTKSGYLFNSLSFNYSNEGHREPVVVNIDLQKANVNATAVLNNIFFETGKFDITEKSFTELNEIVRFLNENPSLRVEIGGHTDNVGTEGNNQVLSQKRAQSVVHYLSNHGIAAVRLAQKGYGSLQPVVQNDSDEHRQANRRIEFRIVQ